MSANKNRPANIYKRIVGYLDRSVRDRKDDAEFAVFLFVMNSLFLTTPVVMAFVTLVIGFHWSLAVMAIITTFYCHPVIEMVFLPVPPVYDWLPEHEHPCVRVILAGIYCDSRYAEPKHIEEYWKIAWFYACSAVCLALLFVGCCCRYKS